MVIFPLAQQTVEHVSEMHWLLAPPAWVTFLILLAIWSFAIGLYLLESKKSSLLVRMICAALLGCFLTGVLLVLYDPVRESYTIETQPSSLLIAVDTSTSMEFKDRYPDAMRDALREAFPEIDPEKLTRLDLVKHAIGKLDAFPKLLERNNLVLYGFDNTRSELGRVEQSDSSTVELEAVLTSLTAEGSMTRIGDALNQMLNDLRAERLAGVVLLSDGQQNSGLITTEQLALRMQRKGIPLFAVGVGNPFPTKDIEVEKPEVANPVIAGDQAKIVVTVHQKGYEPGTVVKVGLSLKDSQGNLDPVANGEIPLESENQSVTKIFQFKADRKGKFTLIVEAEVDPDESNKANNKKEADFEVQDRKIRVLYVDNLPRWEYRYLNHALTRDSSQAAQCFLVSADASFPQESSPGLPSLVGFPEGKSELFEYDVIILGDVDPDILTAEQQKLTRAFVTEHGGGILFIAGSANLPARYGNSPIADLFPFRLEKSNDDELGSGALTKSFPLQLTLMGRGHVISQLEEDTDANERLWSAGPGGFPGQLWHYPIREPKPQARALIVHPFEKTADGKPRPLVLTSYVGMGTVMFQAIDELWRWRVRGIEYFEKYYGQAVRWLASSRLDKSKRFNLNTDKSKYSLRERVKISATILNPQLEPESAGVWTVRIFGGDIQEDLLLQRVPERPGDYEGSYVPPKRGDYRVAIMTETGGSEATSREEIFAREFEVEIPKREKQDRKMAKQALEEMARLSGGAYYDLAAFGELVTTGKIGSAAEKHKEKAAQVKLWDHWAVLGILIALASAEWILRKLFKLV